MTTGVPVTVSRTARPFVFAGLPSHTRGEVALWNWHARFLRDATSWKKWMQDAWGDLLLAPAGLEVTLAQANSVDAQAQTRAWSFKQSEVLIGRDPSSDIVLDTLAAAKRHARLIVDRGRCFLEDLGSSLGTYCNQTRVPANQRKLLEIGDEISVFPYVFKVGIRQIWARQTDIGIYSNQVDSMTWEAFTASAARGRRNFAIRLHPTGAWIHLEISRAFLAELGDRILRPLDLDVSPVAGGATEQALFEFLILCLTERANRDLPFPWQLEVVSGEAPAPARRDRGVSIAASISLLTTTGALRAFVPFATLEGMRAALPQPAPVSAPAISWQFPISYGAVDLTAQELAGLERRDILVPVRRFELLLPHRFDRGWSLQSLDSNDKNSLDPHNFNRLQIEKYFEREPLSNQEPLPNQPQTNAAPDFNQLPVRIHVIVGEKELTLAEAAHLTNGSILELDRDPAAPVSLAVNGKVLGEGQLVDVEGRLGVRILSWRGA